MTDGHHNRIAGFLDSIQGLDLYIATPPKSKLEEKEGGEVVDPGLKHQIDAPMTGALSKMTRRTEQIDATTQGSCRVNTPASGQMDTDDFILISFDQPAQPGHDETVAVVQQTIPLNLLKAVVVLRDCLTAWIKADVGPSHIQHKMMADLMKEGLLPSTFDIDAYLEE